MTTKLLIIKSGRGYVRFLDDSFLFSDMNKASVFPLEQISTIKEKLQYLLEEGVNDAKIKLLTISEDQYQEDP